MSVNWITHKTEISLKWVLFSPENEGSWPPIGVPVFAKIFGGLDVLELHEVDRGRLAQALEGDEDEECEVMYAFSFYDGDGSYNDGLEDGDEFWWLSGLTPGDIERIP